VSGEVRIRDLIQLALDGLHRMQLASGLFCYTLRPGVPHSQGVSVRYSLMVYLGLRKAERAGWEHGFDMPVLEDRLFASLDSPHLRPGDFGLYLWADAVGSGGRRVERLLHRLVPALQESGGLETREGQEVSWIANGLSHTRIHGLPEEGEQLLRQALDLLVGRNQAPPGLFYHRAVGIRRRFPNFASEIYCTHALASAASLEVDGRALPAAIRAGDEIARLQLADGGWPWIFDVNKSRVVEPYEIYSVHQHAMAPMALLQLAEASGERRFVDYAARGLSWICGTNELAQDMVDEGERIIYRSIRRQRPWDRVQLYTNTASAALLGRSIARNGWRIELDTTCRPYELGWLLEAWCGREHILDRAT
jgi:hypothetical protein